ncbi:S8 family serine peptidase [Actinomyces bowdenii]|uniref:Serine protease n=1 Tax=Actinomyces bowdenii TaxID=131109 RepID=A0A3P1UQG5_9ACTO|nr:S8 family serine peptidase [Actinomyces bowdenii]RRD23366.1 serine protease [Actinomyces bowdenii]
MSTPLIRRFASLAAAALVTALALPAAPAPASPRAEDPPPASAAASSVSGSPLMRELAEELRAQALPASPEQVRVLVTLKEQPAGPSEAQESASLNAQNDLLGSWSQKHGLSVGDQFGYLVNGFSATMPASSIAGLALEPEVASVKRERVYYATEHTARELEGVPAAFKDHGADGTGTVISIIDSGVDPSHPDLRLDDCGAAKISAINPEGGLFTCKVPNGYNYADESFEIRDLTSSQHGQHVAGIAAANGSQGTESEFATTGRVDGAAPNAQLLAMKVFSNDPSRSRTANDSDIIAAIEDSVKLGADVINMSLGSTNGIPDASDGAHQAIARAREAGVLTVVAAGNEGQSFSTTGVGDDVLGRWDDGTINAPAAQGPALAVASIDNSAITVPRGYLGQGGSQTAFTYELATGAIDDEAHALVDVGLGRSSDYAQGARLNGAYALVERGEISFAQKYRHALDHGASGILVFNSEQGGTGHVTMGGVGEHSIVGASLTRADGLALRRALAEDPGQTVRLTRQTQVLDNPSSLAPSSFSSWGTTPGLDFKPEISGIGGSVYSTVGSDSYASDSGTSMAAPNIAGMSALMHQALAQRHPGLSGTERMDLATRLLMNTAAIPTDAAGTPFPPRQVGAGLAQVDRALASPVSAAVDGRPAVALREVGGPTTMTLTLTNHSQAEAAYTLPAQQVLTETNEAGQPTAPVVSDETLTASTASVSVPAGGSAEVSFTLTPGTASPHFIEGWLRLEADGAHPDLSVPYLGFVGDWDAESIIQEPGRTWAEGAPRDSTGLLGSSPQGPMPLSHHGSPLALSPNHDGNLDGVLPGLLLMRNAERVTYEILDSSGTVLATLGNDENVSREIGKDIVTTQGNGLITHKGQSFDGGIWNAQQGRATTIPDGDYTYRVSARLGEDRPWQVVDLPFTVDTIAPSITILEQEENSVRFTATDEGTGLLMAPRAYLADETAAEVTELEDGSYRATFSGTTPFLRIEAVDRGMTLTSERLFYGEPGLYVTIDGRAMPAELLVGSSGASLSIHGFASGGAARVTVNGSEAPVDRGEFWASVPTSPSLKEVRIRSYDDAGARLAEVSASVIHDGQAPVITITGEDLVDGEVVFRDDGTARLTGTVTDDRASAGELQVLINGEQVILDDQGGFSHTVMDTGSIVTWISATDGAHWVDEELPIRGRSSGSVHAPTMETEGCDPSTSICLIKDSHPSLSEDGSLFTMRGHSGGTEVGSIEFIRGSRAEGGTITAHEPIIAQIKDDGSFDAPLPVSPGMTEYRMVVRDERGAIAWQYIYRLYLDTEPPTITMTEPLLTGGTLYTNHGSVAFRGSISDNGWGYYLALNNATAADFVRLDNPGAEVNSADFEQVLTVRDGDVIRVYSVDAIGNILIGLIPVTVDTTAPSVGVDTVSANETIRDGRSLNAWAEDANLASMRVSLNGRVIEDKRTALTSERMEVEDALQPTEDPGQGPSLGSRPEGAQDGEPSPAAPAAQDGREAPAAGGAPADPATEADGSQASEPSIDAYGSRTTSTGTRLEAAVETADLAAGRYRLAVESTDLAGNTTTQIRCFVIDDAAVITGPDVARLTVAPGELGDQEAVAAKLLALYSVTDDGAADAEGGTSLSLLPGTVLVDGASTVRIVATDAAGHQVIRSVEVTITVSAPESAPDSGSGGSSGTQAPRVPMQPGERPVDPLPAGAVDDVRSRWEAASQGNSHVKSTRAQGALPGTGSGAVGLMALSLMALAAGGVVIRLRRRRH